ncbi:MAG: DUF1540 domain-containing protein [Armatimonadetes bacterium]|nr:DUF1540 domain-containing protein [Armatimonadota bacterium]
MAATDSTELTTDAAGTAGQSVVGGCSVSVCRYNRDGQCAAGTIHIALDGMAHCAAFVPGDDTDTAGTGLDMGGKDTI